MSCYPTVIKAKCVKSKWLITVQKFDQQNCLVNCLEIELEHLLFCIIMKCTLNMTDKEVYIANIIIGTNLTHQFQRFKFLQKP